MRDYQEMTVEELEQQLRETFFYTDRIDETVYTELEQLRAALEKKQPVEFSQTAEEFWEKLERDRAWELDAYGAGTAQTGASGKGRPYRKLLRAAVVAAVAVVLLAGAALAAGSFGYDLWAWVPRWNSAAGRYEPAATEVSGESPIRAALAELGITEPVYPAKLPEGFVITESHISEDPLVLMEQYAKGDRLFSITVTPIKGFKNAVYQASGLQPQVYRSGKAVHYVFANEETIIAVWYTKYYATTVSGNIPLEEIERIMESFGSASERGNAP